VFPIVETKIPAPSPRAFVSVNKYEPGTKFMGRKAVTNAVELLRTCNGMASNVTIGVVMPKLRPVIVMVGWFVEKSVVVPVMIGGFTSSSPARISTGAAIANARTAIRKHGPVRRSCSWSSIICCSFQRMYYCQVQYL
jgi:hypothetical protein